MKYNIAKMNALKFAKERKENIRIAKAKKLEKYVVLFENEKITKNYIVVETIKGRTE